jgi:anhydro-N-acetylmuramic acid kinase
VSFEDRSVSVVQTLSAPIPADLKADLLTLCEASTVSPEHVGEIDRRLGICLGNAVISLLAAAGVNHTAVRAVGSHGQTIRHRPGRAGAQCGFTWQIGDPNSIAEITGICTVADFRRRDIAAGGQGAPLVPAFHAWAFRSRQRSRVVVNIGGMANLSLLPADPSQSISGFDTGPGNALLDAWIRRHRQLEFDADGQWARTGTVDLALLGELLQHPFLALPPPKSTGREDFHLGWLDRTLGVRQLSARNVQATLAEFTARTICDALLGAMPECEEIFVCGGGVHNSALIERIGELLEPRALASTALIGLDPDWVEAGAFAWLARQTVAGRPGNLPGVTGARHPVVLGAVYPGAV